MTSEDEKPQSQKPALARTFTVKAADAMIGQPEFESFRPSVARAIAQARDEKQRADHPEPVTISIDWIEIGSRLEISKSLFEHQPYSDVCEKAVIEYPMKRAYSRGACQVVSSI